MRTIPTVITICEEHGPVWVIKSVPALQFKKNIVNCIQINQNWEEEIFKEDMIAFQKSWINTGLVVATKM